MSESSQLVPFCRNYKGTDRILGSRIYLDQLPGQRQGLWGWKAEAHLATALRHTGSGVRVALHGEVDQTNALAFKGPHLLSRILERD